MLVVANLLLYFVCNLAKKAVPKTCSSLLANETGCISDGGWKSGARGSYSLIEALVGDKIDFYNVLFYNQNDLEYSNSEELILSSRMSPYTSICELERFGHVPLDKVVVGKCTCDGCGNAKASLAVYRKTPLPAELDPNIVYYVSPKTLSESFAEVPLKDALGGIAVWKFGPQTISGNNWTDFHLPLDEQENKSAFYSDRKDTTSDVPRYVVYVNDNISEDLEGWEKLFSQANSVGVNYMVLGFYSSWEIMDQAVYSWGRLAKLDKEKLKASSKNTRLLLGFSAEAGPMKELIRKQKFLKVIIRNLIAYAKNNLYDGIDFYPGDFDKKDEETIVCGFSYMTYWLKKLWPESIISHAPQASHFGPLIETVDKDNRNNILKMFEKGRLKGCYRKHLEKKRRNNVPAPDPTSYRRPIHEPGILPPNHYSFIPQNRGNDYWWMGF